MENKEKKKGLQDFKKKRDSAPRRSLQEILQGGAGSSGGPPRGAGTTSKPAAEISAKGRDEPVVRNLPDALSRTPLPGVSSSDIPLQGASSSSIPAGEGWTETVGETSPTVKPALADQRAPLEETRSAEGTEEKEKGMETDPPSIQAKERAKNRTL
jgi:hypothetical protein